MEILLLQGFAIKDWNEKPDPQGNACRKGRQAQNKTSERLKIT
jgi:hypothetical protein